MKLIDYAIIVILAMLGQLRVGFCSKCGAHLVPLEIAHRSWPLPVLRVVCSKWGCYA